MASIQFNQSSTLKSLQFSLFQFRGHQLSVWPDPGKDLRASGQTDRSWCIVVLWHSSWSHTCKWNIYCLTVSNTWPCLPLITRRLLTRYIRFLAGTICVSLDPFWFPSPPPFNLSTLHLNGGEKKIFCVWSWVVPLREQHLSRWAKPLEEQEGLPPPLTLHRDLSGAPLCCESMQHKKKPLCDASEGYKQPVRRAEGVAGTGGSLFLLLK